MRSLLILFISLILYTNNVIGQIAMIQDKDGYTNVRSKPQSDSDVIYKLYEDEIFWFGEEYYDESKTWVPVYITFNKFSIGSMMHNYFKGYIHKSRLNPLEENLTKDSNVNLEYEIVPFNTEKRFIRSNENGVVYQIDGLNFFGTDGELPKTEVKSVKVEIDGKRIVIPEILYQDLYNCNNRINIFKKEDLCFFENTNSDGAGGYQIIWVFKSGKLIQRLVGSIY
ncbi:hypothetical protein [Flammeovirga sp. EKP202]|uniref:hypothetical protein n=1 Tax=Flammeovirga sp. EKP202 TaxID=2770592 RepID=UPI00165FEFC7|nr:hypothetical protein [Flammeovirga sp. EKP202]MBD0403031.1 hypothetical protein [Flammeovirga sp. EKP202]